ncbi:MAG: hypothetical protein ACE14V_07400 [bacterium]
MHQINKRKISILFSLVMLTIGLVNIGYATRPDITLNGSGTVLIGDARVLVASGGTPPYTWSIKTISGAPAVLSEYTGATVAFLATVDPGTCTVIVTDHTGAVNTTQNLVVIPAPKPLKSLWVWGTSNIPNANAATTLVTTATTHQVRDIFLLVKGESGTFVTYRLNWLLQAAKAMNTNLRIHPWIICFKDATSARSGNYTTYGSTTSWITPMDTKFRQYLMNTCIIPLVRDYPDIAGIHVDYFRYSGAGSRGFAGNNDTSASVVAFCQEIVTTIRKYNPSLPVSIAIKAEDNIERTYGQDYFKFSNVGTRILAPMSYAGEYNQPASWVGVVAKRVRDTATQTCLVYAGEGTNGATANEIAAETCYALDSGAEGICAFCYPLSAAQWAVWDTVGTALPITFSPQTAICIPVGNSVIISADGGWKPFAQWTTNNWSIGSVAVFFGDDSVRFYAQSTGTCVITVKDSAPGPRESNSALITVTPSEAIEKSVSERIIKQPHSMITIHNQK